ncbi:alanine acetyltransferase [Jeotgalibacillus alimentarius]|uniref:Alanine acetyltransferase n=1 Tax=Jeotgalibacillus alimentarius TaxID=135826 RepID=A0A0C2W3W2_9BACL|nr:GNAT family protein [Jeotgalibacillus alimentarius]KIL50753.1 alanine acetyltransferase [Jeotgalibacillus alimentarius]
MVLLKSSRLYFRPLSEQDIDEFVQLLIRNKQFWTIFEPKHPEPFYTREAQLEKLAEAKQAQRLGKEYSWGIYHTDTNRLIGSVSIYSIRRLPFASAYIGYSLDEDHTKQGYGTEAVEAALRFAFREFGLHRVEAMVSPKNEASQKVLEKVGMFREGTLRKNLFINGVWEDHYLYSMLEEDF